MGKLEADICISSLPFPPSHRSDIELWYFDPQHGEVQISAGSPNSNWVATRPVTFTNDGKPAIFDTVTRGTGKLGKTRDSKVSLDAPPSAI
ncbi:hypothetical protein SAMN06265368_0968 [Cohaesibacter gelatinilyticus]|uniref:Uncharacterized protein n=1 Tax=Cohaesibacter gelatinilyticus TaxID=372072 RepID=A0A285NHU9_9HYPH|nr:hypothetical protein SAMN06265368_0968 [Cohaesibacter gelatinilyticus]